MSATAISISLDEDLLAEVDRMVQAQRYGDRDQLVRDALREKLARESQGQARLNRRGRPVPGQDLEAQLALLDVDEERAWADLGLEGEASQWPQY